ncbi:MAG: hypothetical protein N3A02_02310, partial [Rectinema sp.]|nr:hypothetical protein [Rectinema sp.]
TNGQKPADVHLCTEELAEAMRQSQLALSVAHDYHGREPVLRGTHVSRQPPESSHGIFFAHDGEEFDI